MQTLLSKYWLLIAAIWYTGNGILHDIFVIIKHKDGYNRELLRLLMDGHVLILSGILMFITYLMVNKGITYGPIVAIVVTAAMLVYCVMIFPFLKSVVTMLVSLVTLIVAVRLLTA
ncbi:MAG: hypothetical protein K0Q79_1861 [Flavipsychrobacter sp.]|jgi:hypothetical protein|nr:hypothetical protein [Flavipsychrobacter sp.]